MHENLLQCYFPVSFSTERASECQFHLLKLSYDKILFVDDENSFALCRNRLTKVWRQILYILV